MKEIRRIQAQDEPRLLEAAKCGDKLRVEQLIKAGCRVDCRDAVCLPLLPPPPLSIPLSLSVTLSFSLLICIYIYIYVLYSVCMYILYVLYKQQVFQYMYDVIMNV